MPKIQTPRPTLILGLLLAILLCMLLPYCGRPDPLLVGNPTVENVAKSLKEDEKAKTVIGRSGIVSVSRDKNGSVKGKARYLPPEGSVSVTVKNTGEVVVNVKSKGFTFRPGVGAATFGGDLAPVVDVKFAYSGRLGLSTGTGLTKQTVARPYVALTYQIHNNTALFLGCSVKKDIVAGLRLSF